MKHIDNILVCIQSEVPNDDMFAHAIEIAKKNNATIKLVHVVDDYPEDTSKWWNVQNPKKLKRKIVAERDALLDKFAGLAKSRGLDRIESQLMWGRPFIEIVREVLRNKHDLVMIAARRRHKVSRVLLGCPSLDLLQHCPCTVWVAKKHDRKSPRRVLATVGGRREEFSCDAMDVKVLQTAAAIAMAEDSELHFAHALTLYGGKGQKKGKKLRADLAEYIESMKKHFKDKCGSMLEGFGAELDDDRVHVIAGPPVSVITDLVDDLGVDLVVMGGRITEGLQAVLMGNHAMKVFESVNCDVAEVKPDDFVSLVEREHIAK